MTCDVTSRESAYCRPPAAASQVLARWRQPHAAGAGKTRAARVVARPERLRRRRRHRHGGV